MELHQVRHCRNSLVLQLSGICQHFAQAHLLRLLLYGAHLGWALGKVKTALFEVFWRYSKSPIRLKRPYCALLKDPALEVPVRFGRIIASADGPSRIQLVNTDPQK